MDGDARLERPARGWGWGVGAMGAEGVFGSEATVVLIYSKDRSARISE